MTLTTIRLRLVALAGLVTAGAWFSGTPLAWGIAVWLLLCITVVVGVMPRGDVEGRVRL